MVAPVPDPLTLAPVTCTFDFSHADPTTGCGFVRPVKDCVMLELSPVVVPPFSASTRHETVLVFCGSLGVATPLTFVGAGKLPAPRLAGTQERHVKSSEQVRRFSSTPTGAAPSMDLLFSHAVVPGPTICETTGDLLPLIQLFRPGLVKVPAL